MTEDVFFPESMKAVHNWCAWRLENRKCKLTKVPYMLPGRKAESNNPDTWSSFETISAIMESAQGYFSGYGFMISNGFVFIDCDHCVNDGEIDGRGKDVLSAFTQSYAEISQSGHGLHILSRGTIPRSFNNRKAGIEMYGSGRFCALTGNAIQRLAPSEEQDGISYIFHKYATHKPDVSSRLGSTLSEPEIHTDGWIIRHASSISGTTGRNFVSLFSGDTSNYESASEADAALCVLLAFWCDRNREQIDRIFRQSGLYRPKWEREDYKNRTIEHACSHIPESFSEWQDEQKQDREKKLLNASARQIFDAWEAKT